MSPHLELCACNVCLLLAFPFMIPTLTSQSFVPAPPLSEDLAAHMPPPLFIAPRKVCHIDVTGVEDRRAFDVDISQYDAATQQLICLLKR